MNKKGSVFGATFLIAGSCIGAGMLGLPVVTGLAGFFPSLIMFSLVCFFMTSTGLLLVEVQGNFSERANFPTMVKFFLGPVGKAVCFILYTFLFYAILVAYLAQSGGHIGSYATLLFPHFPAWGGSLLFAAIFGYVIYHGTKFVDHTNRVFMIGKIVFFLLLVGFGLTHITPSLLMYSDRYYLLMTLPILVISFGFHNMVPVIYHYLGDSKRRTKHAILWGSLLTLCVYLIWQVIALGNLPVSGPDGLMSSFRSGIDAAEAMKRYLGFSILGTLASILAFFAIVTSFLAQSLSLVHFLADSLKVKTGRKENVWILLLTFIPPTITCVLNPQIFYIALGIAGGIFAVLLFGVLPVLMVWVGKAQHEMFKEKNFFTHNVVLTVLMVISLFIVVYQVVSQVVS